MASQVRKVRLDNGATLVMERSEHVRSVSVGVWVKVGSSIETPALSGMSHFIEHMTFKGTENRSSLELATVLESLGGDLNAFTDREVTCYHSTVLSEHVDVALDVLSDLTLHPIFPKKEIEREKKVLLQELSMIDEAPDEQAQELFFGKIWKGHPLGQPVIGTKYNIENFDRKIAHKFFKQYYHPENMVISVAGNIDTDSIIAKCEVLFKVKDKWKAPVQAQVKSPVVYHPTFIKSTTATDQLHLIVGFEGLSIHDRQRFDALVLNFYLGGGMSSRLFQEIREKAALAYTVDCDFIPYSEAGVCAIYLALQPKTLERCLSILGKEIKAVCRKPISAETLAMVKNQIKGAVILSSELIEAKQESLGRNEVCFGRHVTTDEILGEINNVTVEKVQKVAQRIFVPEKETTVTLSRVKPKTKKVSIFL